MSRIETIARGLLVIGLLAGLATVAVMVGGRVFGTSDAPAIAELGPLLRVGDVIHQRERSDLATQQRNGRSVLMSVPEALNQEAARNGMLRLLRSSGWVVSSGGGAVPRDGTVCLAVTTPTSWLAERANAELSSEFEDQLSETHSVAVVVDMFFC